MMTSLKHVRAHAAPLGLALILTALPAASWAAPPVHYTLDPAKSTLEFNFVGAGDKNKGKFHKFTVTLDFSPESVPAGKLDVVVDINSVDTGNKDWDGYLADPSFFDPKKYPQGHFLATQITKTAAGYVAQGKLTIRSVTKDTPVPFAFRTATEGGKAVGYLTGSTTIHRLDFGVGQGEWANTGSDGIGNDVTLVYSLRLTAAP